MGIRLWIQEEPSVSIHCIMDCMFEVAMASPAISLVKEIVTASACNVKLVIPLTDGLVTPPDGVELG
jgi:hypothetical protein